MEDANDTDNYSTNYANPVLVAAAGGYLVISFFFCTDNQSLLASIPPLTHRSS